MSMLAIPSKASKEQGRRLDLPPPRAELVWCACGGGRSPHVGDESRPDPGASQVELLVRTGTRTGTGTYVAGTGSFGDRSRRVY